MVVSQPFHNFITYIKIGLVLSVDHSETAWLGSTPITLLSLPVFLNFSHIDIQHSNLKVFKIMRTFLICGEGSTD